MEIEIRIDAERREPKVIVLTDKMTEEVSSIIQKLSEEQQTVIAGFRDDILEILDPGDIYRVYASNGKVFAETSHGEYSLRLRLYETEQRLDSHVFVRISNSEIINLKRVTAVDLSLTGTICMTLDGSVTAYVSRRFVKKIKETLDLGRRGGK